LKIRYGSIRDNIMGNVNVKFNNDQLFYVKVLVHGKSDNKNGNKNNFCGNWGPVSWTKNLNVLYLRTENGILSFTRKICQQHQEQHRYRLGTRFNAQKNAVWCSNFLIRSCKKMQWRN